MPAWTATRPFHLFALLALVVTLLGGGQPLPLSYWMGLSLVMVLAVQLPARHKGYLLLATLTWLGWYLFSWLFALVQVELLSQAEILAGRPVWPATLTNREVAGLAWMLAGLPPLLGLNLDYRSGAKRFVSFRRGLLLGAATGPALAGLVTLPWFAAAAGAWLPAVAMGWMATQTGRYWPSGWLKGCALLFPVSLAAYLLPRPDIVAWTLAGLAGGWACLPQPGVKKLVWGSVFAGFGWFLTAWFAPEIPAPLRLGLGAGILIIVGARWYDWNWVSVVLAPACVILAALLFSRVPGWFTGPWIREGLLLPLSLAALLALDINGRTWNLPKES